MDQSLDDIIRAKKSARGRGGRGRGSGRGRGRGGGFKARGGTAGAVSRGGGAGRKFRRQPTEQVSGKWQHDMFSPSPRRGGGRGGAGGRGGGGGALSKLLISNLDYGVSTDDIKELFSEFGRLVKAEVHYDKSGRSLGTATVIYSRHQDADKAVTQYNNVPLDGRPMTVQVLSGAAAAASQVANGGGGPVKQRVGRPQQQQQQAMGGGGGGRGRGRGRGRGGRGRGAKTPVPTADELDADLDAYKQTEMET